MTAEEFRVSPQAAAAGGAEVSRHLSASICTTCQLLRGSIAGTIAKTVVYPLDRLKMKLQVGLLEFGSKCCAAAAAFFRLFPVSTLRKRSCFEADQSLISPPVQLIFFFSQIAFHLNSKFKF